ncbi:Amino-acid carrier protein AlsT [Planctomycetes bacterium Poly30]|uniref:Amino-acid carrier protein AlsT n=1 Tax=Saltatorellus ferox TaxID=2528018 RepID=A0A518EQA0_9BACT|nr:Amino-acid carrier protein AlsT [Planctomycetes bacterium Poly30]
MRSPHRLLIPLVLSLFCAAASSPAAASSHADAPASQEADGALQETVDAVENAAGEATDAVQNAAGAVSDVVEDSVSQDSGEDWQTTVDKKMTAVNTVIEGIFFFPIPIPGTTGVSPTAIPFTNGEKTFSQQTIPFAVLWLVLGAIFFTVRMGFVQLRLVGHAIAVTRGKWDDPDLAEEGEVSHFEALSAALSATVGLGNIAGVAIAISLGGPGATLWMILAGFLGMASKFTECSLGQMYRQTRSDGSVMGGAMYYLSHGLKEQGMGGLGKVLAVMFAILCIGGSLAGGNSFQVNQSLGAIGETVSFFGENADGVRENGWIYGAIMTVAVGAVILGGLRRIADVASKIVPLMCGIYVAACLFVILSNVGHVGPAFQTIIDGAFNPDAALGGIVGVLIVGFQRAAFSNEAGVGSAAIAHSAAKTEYPVREGIVALLEPLIDTIIVCTMTALVIVITDAYVRVDEAGELTQFANFIDSKNGAALTSQAFGTTLSWFPYVLSIAVALFAFSTMISWSYYGERCFAWLFGDGLGLLYKALFLTFTFLGSVITAKAVLNFGDLMILGMAIPNVLGVILLSGKVKAQLDEYVAKKKSGEMKQTPGA